VIETPIVIEVAARVAILRTPKAPPGRLAAHLAAAAESTTHTATAHLAAANAATYVAAPATTETTTTSPVAAPATTETTSSAVAAPAAAKTTASAGRKRVNGQSPG
jgi:hypothetical protein